MATQETTVPGKKTRKKKRMQERKEARSQERRDVHKIG
jgi:hypothetical protein